ncbi:DUF3460 family protein [Pseudoduganella sp. GCM10020061]|jgi:uncharacterized Ntn-hydrolase superfamily protein|uniref:DUF3460 family protein n=1 Tax=Pseudoduganella sp. GCM10020061 TaxID=3317345 RepID=UPI00363BB5B6
MHKTKGAYVSEFERYMDAFLKKHPDVIEDQERGWYIWWDHRLDLDQAEKERESEVPAKPYPYD